MGFDRISKTIYTEFLAAIRSPKQFLAHKLVKQTGILLSGDAVSRLISLISLTFTVRLIGAEAFGILAVAENYAKLIDAFFNFRAWTGIIKFGALALENGDYRALGRYIRIGFFLDVIFSLVSFLVALLAAPLVASFFKWDQEIIFFLKTYSLLVLFNFTGTAIGILRLSESFSFLAFQRLIYAMARLTGVVIAFFLGGGFKAFLLAWLISEVLSYLLLVFKAVTVAYRKGWILPLCNRGLPANPSDKVAHISTSVKPFVLFIVWSNLSSTVDIPVKFLDVLIVSSVVSVEATGVYKVFQQISHVLKKPMEPFYQVVYPYFSAKVAKGKSSTAVSGAFKTIGFMVPFIVLLLVILILPSPWWLPRLFGSDFEYFLTDFALYMLVSGFSVLVANIAPLFMALGFMMTNFFIQAFSNIAFVSFAWWWGGVWGMKGIIVALGIQVVIVSGLKLLFILKKSINIEAT